MYRGAPLSDATVTLVPEQTTWVGVGQTDGSGVATIRTQGRYLGIPEGTYTVTVSKHEAVSGLPPDPTSPDEDVIYSQKLESVSAAKLIVPEKYTCPETSDLRVTISNKPLMETLELTD